MVGCIIEKGEGEVYVKTLFVCSQRQSHRLGWHFLSCGSMLSRQAWRILWKVSSVVSFCCILQLHKTYSFAHVESDVDVDVDVAVGTAVAEATEVSAAETVRAQEARRVRRESFILSMDTGC